MSGNYEKWEKLFKDQTLEQFSTDRDALLWLKVKSITRKGIIDEFCKRFGIDCGGTKLEDKQKKLYLLLCNDVEKSHGLLDSYMRSKNQEIVAELDKGKLISGLREVESYKWGGDYQNSLDKYLVSRYVKPISSYDLLIPELNSKKFDTEISRAVQGYVLNSWYNHWSSILIEHIFKAHPVVLPTVGKVKGVDFFIKDIPFDLKVTYFPAEFLKAKRKTMGYPVESTYLKATARKLGIQFDKSAKGKKTNIHEITEKLKNKNTPEVLNAIQCIQDQNMEIVIV